MKINWKIVIAVVVVVVTAFWAFDSVRIRSYNGTHLSFGVGDGSVTVTNPSNDPVAIQLSSAGARSFSVSSKTQGLSGSSSSQNGASGLTQFIAFEVPSGVSEFTVARGSNVNFTGNADKSLAVAVSPLSSGEASTTLLAAFVIIGLALFYISRTTHHGWLKQLRGGESVERVNEKLAEWAAFKRRFGGITSDKP
jgi:hypothetical protein